MGFAIQAAVRQGGGRPSYRAYSGRSDNAAGGRLGAKTAVGGLQDTARAGTPMVFDAVPGAVTVTRVLPAGRMGLTESGIPPRAAVSTGHGARDAAAEGPVFHRDGGLAESREGVCRVSFLLRVVLPDRPGSLGAVATALGNAGADILGVDVVERSDGHAVDDLAVELPSGRPPDVLITAAESVPGVEVESVRPHSGRLDTARELALIEEITNDPKEGLALLAEGVPRIFRAGWAIVVVREGTRAYRLAQSAAAPETVAAELPWLPLERTIVIDPEVQYVPVPWTTLDTELAAAPLGLAPRALVVGRPGGPAFRPSELARLTHLTGIIATVLPDA